MPPHKGRKRTIKCPGHIDADFLPYNVEYVAVSDYFRIRYTDESGKKRYKRLCDGKATLLQILKAQQSYQPKADKSVTFTTLSNDFQTTSIWRGLAATTQKDYTDCHKKICAAKTGNGLFGNVPITSWKKSTLLKYRDFRGEDSKSRANKELSYIKRVFSWAFEYEKIKDNVTLGVSKLHVPPRQHYANDTDFNFLITVAKESGYWYLPYALELAYECRMRRIEVLDMTDANETPDGLMINRRKGSRSGIVEWSDNLRAIWGGAKAERDKILKKRKQPIPIDPSLRFLFISAHTGNHITADGLSAAKDRVSRLAKQKAAQLGLSFVNFTIHDTKRKATTDYIGNKQEAGGWRSASMLSIYDVSKPKSKPTRSTRD